MEMCARLLSRRIQGRRPYTFVQFLVGPYVRALYCSVCITNLHDTSRYAVRFVLR
jgi:hypothetical protein